MSSMKAQDVDKVCTHFQNLLSLTVSPSIVLTVLQNGRALCLLFTKTSSIPLAIDKRQGAEAQEKNLQKFLSKLSTHPNKIQSTITAEEIIKGTKDSELIRITLEMCEAKKPTQDNLIRERDKKKALNNEFVISLSPSKRWANNEAQGIKQMMKDKYSCKVCLKAVMNQPIEAFNNIYHEECFTCSECFRRILLGEKFLKTNGDEGPQPFCIDCDGERVCFQCEGVIGYKQRYHSVGEDKYHSDCLTCFTCKQSVIGQGFIRSNDKIFCSQQCTQNDKQKTPISQSLSHDQQSIDRASSFSPVNSPKTRSKNRNAIARNNTQKVSSSSPSPRMGERAHRSESNLYSNRSSPAQLPPSFPLPQQPQSPKLPPKPKPPLRSSNSSGSPQKPPRVVESSQTQKPTQKPPKTDKPDSLPDSADSPVGVKPSAQNGLCSTCFEKVGSLSMTANGKVWHRDCFKCAQCVTKISGPFFELEEKIYCKKCHEATFAARCDACLVILTGEYLILRGKNYHNKCLNCTICDSTFAEHSSYNMFEGKNYCNSHRP